MSAYDQKIIKRYNVFTVLLAASIVVVQFLIPESVAGPLRSIPWPFKVYIGVIMGIGYHLVSTVEYHRGRDSVRVVENTLVINIKEKGGNSEKNI